MQISDINKWKPVIQKILEDYPETQDSLEKLLVRLWMDMDKSLKSASFFDFTQKFALGIYGKIQSIDRAVRSVKEDHPELKGKQQERRNNDAEQIRKHYAGDPGNDHMGSGSKPKFYGKYFSIGQWGSMHKRSDMTMEARDLILEYIKKHLPESQIKIVQGSGVRSSQQSEHFPEWILEEAFEKYPA